MPPSVSAAAPHELMPALRMLFGRRPDPDREGRAERCRAAIAAGAADPTAVFVSRDGAGRVCGAALVQALPGALGVARPPRADSPEAGDALAAAACDWLRARGVKVCQAFMPADELPDAAPLERNGFRHVTQLVSMRREVDRERDALPPGEGPDGVYYRPEFRERFAATLLATHEGTLDCPELNGTRTPAELAAGFDLPDRESSGHFLAESGGVPVGLVMFEPGDDRMTELTYLGVVPAARGSGVGDRLVRLVLHHAGLAGHLAVSLAVDARNEPALRLYRRHGFAETERREVWLAQFPGGARPFQIADL
jgi:mycothiol synthase